VVDPIEHELMRRAQAGDTEAFEMLHARLEPDLARFTRRLIGPGGESEDVTQETLVAFYVNLNRIEPVEMLRPYLFRIARNRCYDILRRQGRYDEVSIEEDDDDPVQVRITFDLSEGSGTAPEEAASWLLLYTEVKEAMDSLPEMQRQALILYSEENMSYQEIASIMGVSIGTIKSRLFHAKRNLRTRLSEETLRLIYDELFEGDMPQEETDDGRSSTEQIAPVRAGRESLAESR
jgi:RNA polymerase sigma-70 factor, ECF subfamily